MLLISDGIFRQMIADVLWMSSMFFWGTTAAFQFLQVTFYHTITVRVCCWHVIILFRACIILDNWWQLLDAKDIHR